MNEAERYQHAKRRVECLRRFFAHLATLLIVGAVLLIVSLVSGGGLWILWPLGIWALILAVHAVRLFIINASLGPEWEERKIKEYMGDSGQAPSTSPPAQGD